MKSRQIGLVAAAALWATSAQAQTNFQVVDGENCPAGMVHVTLEDIQANQDTLCRMLGTWHIVRIAGGGSMDGPGYRCQSRASDTRAMGHALCKAAATAPTPGGNNIAKGAKVRQSSLGFGGDPRRAVDGNPSGNWGHNSVTHTNLENGAWLEVDLGAGYSVDKVVIYNRTDCCAERLNNAVVEVSRTPCDQGTRDVTKSWTLKPSGPWIPHRTELAGTGQGRYLCVRHAPNVRQYLSVAELEVYGNTGPSKVDISGEYQGAHPHWGDKVILRADGTYARGNGDPGRWTFDGMTLVLAWTNWAPETLTKTGEGTYRAASNGFTLTRLSGGAPAPNPEVPAAPAFPTGTVVLRSKLHGQVLDIQGGNRAQGTAVISWPLKSADNANQLWELVPQNGAYLIRSKLNGLVLDINGGNREPGASLIVWPAKATGNDNQLWQFIPHDGGYFIKSRLNDLALDISGPAQGAGVIMGHAKVSDNLNQLFTVEPAPEARPGLPGAGEVFQLKIMGGMSNNRVFLSTTNDGGKADLWHTDDASGRQRWRLEPQAGGKYYHILVFGGVGGSRRYLSVTADGGKVDLWHQDDGSGRQRWVIQNNGDYYTIRILGGVSGQRKILSVPADGSKVDLWHVDDASGRQRWVLQKL